MFYLWKRGCVGALTAEALQVQRGEEEEEGGRGEETRTMADPWEVFVFQATQSLWLITKADSVYEANHLLGQ